MRCRSPRPRVGRRRLSAGGATEGIVQDRTTASQAGAAGHPAAGRAGTAVARPSAFGAATVSWHRPHAVTALSPGHATCRAAKPSKARKPDRVAHALVLRRWSYSLCRACCQRAVSRQAIMGATGGDLYSVPADGRRGHGMVAVARSGTVANGRRHARGACRPRWWRTRTEAATSSTRPLLRDVLQRAVGVRQVSAGERLIAGAARLPTGPTWPPGAARTRNRQAGGSRRRV